MQAGSLFFLPAEALAATKRQAANYVLFPCEDRPPYSVWSFGRSVHDWELFTSLPLFIEGSVFRTSPHASRHPPPGKHGFCQRAPQFRVAQAHNRITPSVLFHVSTPYRHCGLSVVKVYKLPPRFYARGRRSCVFFPENRLVPFRPFCRRQSLKVNLLRSPLTTFCRVLHAQFFEPASSRSRIGSARETFDFRGVHVSPRNCRTACLSPALKTLLPLG